jgi:hypothetical protein
LLGFPVTPENLPGRLWSAKTWVRSAGPDRIVLEQVDTNRPDLWSVEGVCREVRAVAGKAAEYPFLSDPATVGLRLSGRPPWGRHRPPASPAAGAAEMVLLEVADLSPVGWRTAARTAATLTPWYRHWAPGFTIGQLSPPPGVRAADIDVSQWPVLCIGDTASTIVDVHPDGATKAVFVIAGPLARTVRTAAAILGTNLSDRGCRVTGSASTMSLRHAAPVGFDADHLNRVLGTTGTDADVVAALRRLGHEVRGVPGQRYAAPPAWRDDILHPVDLAEDLMQARGEGSVPRIRYARPASGPIAPLNLLAERIAEAMVARGYAECLSHVLRPADPADGDFAPIRRRVDVSHPVTPTYAALRTSLLPGLLETAAIRLRRSAEARVFEVGDTVLLSDDAVASTHWMVGAAVTAGTDSLAELHAAVLGLADLLGAELVAVPAAVPWANPLESAEIRLGDTVIGPIGALTADAAGRRELPVGTACCELRLEPLL